MKIDQHLDANGDIDILRKFPPVFTTGGTPQIDQQASDFNRVDAMYLRLKTVNLAYDLSNSFRKAGIGQCSTLFSCFQYTHF